MSKSNLLVGVDIGTTKVACVVGEETDEGLDIVGIGTHPSEGLRKGVVINIESTVNSIKKAVDEAELMAGCEITSVFVGIAGGHIKSLNSQGTVAIKDREVSDLDVARVLDTAQAVAIPMDRELIHIIPIVCNARIAQPDAERDHIAQRTPLTARAVGAGIPTHVSNTQGSPVFIGGPHELLHPLIVGGHRILENAS